MQLIVAYSLSVKELMTFGIFFILIYFRVLHTSYVKLQPGQMLCNIYHVVYKIPNYL
jgi:hypothetical protein